ncbi:MAG: efflux RND transporter periplasmic adaptor subunit [Bacteroidales bacterium]|nr:efflux RND transporter periplasmic adaptor subunit [Bacteroidales bacterium]
MKTPKLICFFSLLFLLFLGCKRDDKNDKKNSEREDIILVDVVNPTLQKYAAVREYQGVFKPYKEANVGSSIPGKVEKIFVLEGDYVKEGEIIARMSSEMLIQAEIEYMTLKKDFDRVSNLLQKNSISQQDYDHVKARFEAAQAKYELMKKNTEIRAPFSGVVVKHLIKEGENYFFSFSLDPSYSMTSGIVKLMQVNPLICVVDIGEMDFPMFKVGQQVEVVPFAYPHVTLLGRIIRFEPIVSSLDRMVRMHVVVPNQLGLMPGMGGKVKIKTPEKECMALPLETIMEENNKSFVFIEKDGIARKLSVKVSATTGDSVLIEDIPADVRVIKTKVKQLKDGQKVRVIENRTL